MKKNIFVLLCIAMGCSQQEPPQEIQLPPVPETPVRQVSDVIFGKEIRDPYRYLERLKEPDVEAWYKAQTERSRMVLDAISGREGMIQQMYAFDKRKAERVYYLNISDNNRYFYLKQTPADETGKLFYRDGFEGKETLLFDPEVYDPNSKSTYVVSTHYPSPDGSKVAFEVAPNGSESSVLLIMDVAKKSLYPEKIDRCWYADCSWLPDGSSFFYSRLQSSDVHDLNREKDSKIYLHTPGADPSSDKEIFSRAANPELDIKTEEFPGVNYDRDAGHLFSFSNSVDRKIKMWHAPVSELKNPKIKWSPLFSPEDEVYSFATTDTEIFVYTPKGAPNYKILRMPLSNPDINNATAAVPEFSDRSILGMAVTRDGLFFSTSKNGVEASFYHKPFRGQVKEIKLPVSAGRVDIQSRGFRYSEIWVNLAGWTMDGQRYRYNLDTGEFTSEKLSSAAEYPEYANLIVEEVMIKSHDGAEVPLSLVYDKNRKRDGSNPVFMMGYGAYGLSINPFFSPEFLLWTANGGILAVPHVRGGGEMGDAWYRAGHKTTKPNTWKDLIASAEYLIENKYTSAKKIAINGGSAGGILIGRAMTERPDLFAVAIPEVGCLNPLRAEESPNGPVNVPEFGTVKDSLEFLALVEMDSYLHVKDGQEYPATLITAGMNDPRVIAWQPGKFAARLQAANGSAEPILFLADFEAGHGMGDTKSKAYESLADVFSFAFWQTGHPDFQISELPVYNQQQPEVDVAVE